MASDDDPILHTLEPTIQRLRDDPESFLKHLTEESKELFQALIRGEATAHQQLQVAALTAMEVEQWIRRRDEIFKIGFELQEVLGTNKGRMH